MRGYHVVLALAFATGCSSEQQFVLVDRLSDDANLAECKIVVEGHTTMNRGYSEMSWYQTILPFPPFLGPADSWPARHDVDLDVDRVVKGTEARSSLTIRNYRQLKPDEIRRLPYPNDVMGILGGEMRVRLGYDDRSGDRFSNLQIVAIENTPTMAEALRRATTLPASLPASLRPPNTSE